LPIILILLCSLNLLRVFKDKNKRAREASDF
jgi:hypothetical protein